MPAFALIRNRSAVLLILAVVMAGLAYHVYVQRFYLRFIPIPLDYIDLVDTESWLLPASQSARAMGAVDLVAGDLRTEAGLRRTLAAIQAFSPMAGVDGIPNYTDLDFAKWIAEIRSKPFYCTDATQLFILAAWRQGLKAREWHLVAPGWLRGQGHSMVEYFNPERGRWQLVDAQHAVLFRGRDGNLLSMSDLLRLFFGKGKEAVSIEYGAFETAIRAGARGLVSEAYYFGGGMLDTPILQLRQSTWFATVPRSFLISGHFVIGYPIVIDGWAHHPQVLWTKLSLLGFIALAAVFVAVLAVPGNRRHGGKRTLS